MRKGSRERDDVPAWALPMRLSVRVRRPVNPARWSRGRRLIFLLIFALAVSLAVRSLFGEKGLMEWWRMNAEAARLETEVEDLERQLAAEREAVRDLREGTDAIEKLARESLGMAREGEVIYLLPEEAEGESPAEDPPEVE